MDLDLGTIRAFVAVTEDRSFSEAAARLEISQQAVSKRIAKLESDLGVRLFYRSRTGAGLTADGRAFLHYARSLVGIADQALGVLRGRLRSLRVDVLDTRLASVELVRAFHQAAGDVHVDVTTSNGLRSARGALAEGSVDAAFARVSGESGSVRVGGAPGSARVGGTPGSARVGGTPGSARVGGAPEEDLRHVPAYLDPVHLLVSRDHPLAGLRAVQVERLSGSTVWMPGNAPGSEWAEFYRLLGDAFDLRIDASGPDFGWEHFVAEIASGERAGFVGEGCRLPWHAGVVRLPVIDPVPVYPCSLLYHRQNRHPMLAALVEFVADGFRPFDPARQWMPDIDRAVIEGL